MATLKTKILHRNDTTANWTSNNPVLSKGEFGIEWIISGASGVEGSCKVKIGDGFTAWNDLNYFGGDASIITTSGSGNTVIGISSETDANGVITYTLALGNRLTGSGLTANTVLLGNGGVDVKTSSKTITKTLGDDDSTIPTSKAVSDALDDAVEGIDVGVTSIEVTDDDIIVGTSTTATTGAVTIDVKHATKGPSTTTNTTKGPTANVTIDGSGAEGSIKIPKVTVDKYGHTTGLTEQTLSITMPSTDNMVTGIGLTADTIILGNGNSGVKTSSKKLESALTDDDSKVPTSKAVTTAIAAATNAAVVMRGTLGTGGTITALPTASASTLGDAYKVITKDTYAGQSAKVGDVFICYQPTSSTYGWMLIPSGDDIEDTWRAIQVNGTEVLGMGTSTGALNLKAGSNVSLAYDDGTVTIASSYTNSRDPGYGHITPANSEAVTGLEGNTTKISAGTFSENVNFSAANKWIVLAGASGSGNNKDEMKWGHALSDVTAGSKGPTANVTQTARTSKEIDIPAITVDEAGHVTALNSYKLTVIDTDTHYTTGLYIGATNVKSNAATTNGNTYLKLYDNSTKRAEFNIKGTGATTVVSDASGNITINSTNTTYGIVSNTADGLAPAMSTNNNSFLMRVGSANAPTWNSLVALDGGSASTSATEWGTITLNEDGQ